MSRTVNIDRHGLRIAGHDQSQPLYLISGQIHYFRWPRSEWRNLLLLAKAGGLNAVDTVIPWNLHEPEPGRYRFQDEADLGGWLDLCQELGLYAIVRPGPYICAEWENGGFPAWLTGRKLRLRMDDPNFLAMVGRWFDVLLPILTPRQVGQGGPVLLVQIENEHWASGAYGHDDHQQTLAHMLLDRGVSVPLYTCMGPSAMPLAGPSAMPLAGAPTVASQIPEFRNGWSDIAGKLKATQAVWPDNPMIVSELWSGWFDNWGDSAHNGRTPAALDRVLHELTAIGASGFSHWMWAGGTNFGWWGGRTVGGDTIHMTTSYDYDAIIDEFGRPTPKFYVARRHHLFLATLGATLAPILAEAGDRASPAGSTAGTTKVLVPEGVRGRSAGGDPPYRLAQNGGFRAAFLQNTSLERQTVQVFHSDAKRSVTPAGASAVHLSVEVEAGTIKPVFANLPLADGLVLRYHSCRILGFWAHTNPQVLVLYGFEGEMGEVSLQRRDGWQVPEGMDLPTGFGISVEGNDLKLHFWISDRPNALCVDSLLILILSQPRAERLWPLAPADGAASFICGPDMMFENGWTSANGIQPYYHIDATGTVTRQETRSARRFDPPARSFGLTWDTLGVAELSPTAFASDPTGAPDPPTFEQAGCWLGYGVYQAQFELDHDLDTTLAAPWLSDRGILLIDGQRIGVLGVGRGGPVWTLPIRLPAGAHDMRLLVDNLGRFNYGSNTGEKKGLLGDLYWGGRQIDITGGWAALWQEAAFAGEAIAKARPQYVRADAADVNLSAFDWQGSHVWLLRDIEVEEGEQVVLQLTGDRNKGALFANGEVVERFSRHHGGGFIKRDITPMLQVGRNTLALHIENYGGLAWRATLLKFHRANTLAATWRFRAGVTPSETAPDTGNHPRFYRGRFTYEAPLHGPGPFALDAYGLHKGHLWLNGRNLGRYWQIGPQARYKVPASWLQGENELLVFEEEGGRVEHVSIRPV